MTILKFSSFIVCNEYGAEKIGNPHSHATVTFKEKLKHANVTDIFKKKGFTIEDTEACKKVKNCGRYTSKDDCNVPQFGYDADFLALATRAYITAKRTGFNPKLSSTSYPYCNLSSGLQRQFMEYYQTYVHENDKREGDRYVGKHPVWKWKLQLLSLLEEQSNRCILWIYDEPGGQRKTFLGNYIATCRGGALMENGITKDLAFAFQG